MIELFIPLLQAEIATEFKQVFIKIIFPALVVATLYVTYKRFKYGKQSKFSIYASYAFTIGLCYLLGDAILYYVPDQLVTVSAAIVGFASEKTIAWAIDEWNVESSIKMFFNFLTSKFKKS